MLVTYRLWEPRSLACSTDPTLQWMFVPSREYDRPCQAWVRNMVFDTNTSIVKTSKLFINFHMPTNVPINLRLDQVNNFNIFGTRVKRLPTFEMTVQLGRLFFLAGKAYYEENECIEDTSVNWSAKLWNHWIDMPVETLDRHASILEPCQARAHQYSSF